MTTSPIDLWHSAADAFDQRHQRLTPDALGRPTPCDDFDVAALVAHVVDTQVRIGSLLGASTGDGDAWDATRAAIAASLAAPGALEGDVDHPSLGPTAKTRLLAIATHDLVVHTWDLSRAIEVDDTLPPANIQPAIDSILAFPDPVREAVFAPPLDVPDGADPQARLLSISGRRP